MIVVDILRRAGIETLMASVMGRLEVDSSRHIRIKADVLAEDADYSSADILILPGGRRGTVNLSQNAIVREQCLAFSKGRLLAAICAAPSIFASLGLLEGKKATCHPDFAKHMARATLTGESVTVDGNIITGQGLGATFKFAWTVVQLLVGEEKVRQIKKAICYRD